MLADDGWMAGARRVPSPNFDRRPPPATVDLLVVHAISLPPGRFGGDDVIALFTNTLPFDAHPYYAKLRGRRLSVHFFVRRDGEAVQLVSCRHRAWHAGESCWRGKTHCNDFSVGVEVEGDGRQEYAAAQYDALARITLQLAQCHPALQVVGHQHIAPGRKTDPGDSFDWRRYFAETGAQFDGRAA